MCFILAECLVSGCLKDLCSVEEFINEHISANVLSADDHITLGMQYEVLRSQLAALFFA